MFCKQVILKLFCSNAPCQVTILNCYNEIVKVCNVLCYSEICICTRGCWIKVLARYQNQTICRIICLQCRLCQCVSAGFVFTTPSQVLIKLADRNYGLPIANAILSFRQTLF